MESRLNYGTQDVYEEKLPEIIFQSMDSQQTERSKNSSSVPYVPSLCQESSNEHTSSTPYLPKLVVTSQQDEHSYQTPKKIDYESVSL